MALSFLMPNIDQLLNDKIKRITASAIRKEVNPVTKQLRELKREVSRLTKVNSTLEKQLTKLTAQADKKASKGLRASEEEAGAARIGPRSIAATRKKLKLGRREFGLLAGVSSNAIYLWENGESRPNDKSRAALVGLRKVGVREARKILEGME